MHHYVANRGRKALLISVLTAFFLFLFNPVSAFAGAAEKWEYDVVPDQNQRVQITGHKVDQYGQPANNSVYKTSIDTKAASPRSKMGAVGMGRLLKGFGWSALGYAALEGLLEAVDWVIDPEAQSIWRYKKTGDTGVSCSYKTTYADGTIKQKKFYADDGSESFCPYNTALKRLQIRETSVSYPSGTKLEFIAWDPLITATTSNFRFRFKVIRPSGSPTEEYLNVPYKQVPAPEGEKEILTQEQLADYANHTHPDFADPELAPKLNPKWNPNIAPDLFKPGNQWEKDNSPTVKEVEDALDKTAPSSKDTGITPNNPDPTPENPNPAPNGFNLPDFCDWASAVCDFFKDDKNEQLDQPEPPNEINIGQLDTSTFSATAGCPSPIPINITIGTKGTGSISYEPICQFASKWSFVAPLIGFLSGAMILVGVGRKGEDSEI